MALHDIVLYTMRHHVHQFGMLNYRGQHCMFECYKIPCSPYITTGTNHIIGATLFIVETINVALTGIHGTDADSIVERQDRLNAEASSLAKMYDTISSYSNYSSISVCLESIDKVQSIAPVFHGIFESTYNKGFFFSLQECYTMRMLSWQTI